MGGGRTKWFFPQRKPINRLGKTFGKIPFAPVVWPTGGKKNWENPEQVPPSPKLYANSFCFLYCFLKSVVFAEGRKNEKKGVFKIMNGFLLGKTEKKKKLWRIGGRLFKKKNKKGFVLICFGWGDNRVGVREDFKFSLVLIGKE